MCKYNALEKHCLPKVALIHELEWYVLADHIPVINKEKYLLPQLCAMLLAEILVKLLIELYVVVRTQI